MYLFISQIHRESLIKWFLVFIPKSIYLIQLPLQNQGKIWYTLHLTNYSQIKQFLDVKNNFHFILAKGPRAALACWITAPSWFTRRWSLTRVCTSARWPQRWTGSASGTRSGCSTGRGSRSIRLTALSSRWYKVITCHVTLTSSGSGQTKAVYKCPN